MTDKTRTSRVSNAQLGKDLHDLSSHIVSLHERTAQNERAYEKLAEAQAQLAMEVREGFKEMRKAFSDEHRTPWATLISAASVLVIIVISLGGLALMPARDAISRLEVRTQTMTREYRQSLDKIEDKATDRIFELQRQLYEQQNRR